MMKIPPARVVVEGKDLFVEFDGKRIAKRGRPNTPQAGTWVSLDPDYEVRSPPDHSYIDVRDNRKLQ